jgi:hypothetical protein
MIASWGLALCVALHALPAWAQDRDPLDYPLRQYAFLLGIALLGGLVSFYNRVRSGAVAAWNVMHLIGELATSGFAGLMAFWLCAYAGTPQLVTAALVGVAGHMGTRAIAVFEQWASRRFGDERPQGGG